MSNAPSLSSRPSIAKAIHTARPRFVLPEISARAADLAEQRIEHDKAVRVYVDGTLRAESDSATDEAMVEHVRDEMDSLGWLDDGQAHNLYVVRCGKAVRWVIVAGELSEDAERPWCPTCSAPHPFCGLRGPKVRR